MAGVIELRGVGKRYRRLEEHERSLRSIPQLLRSADRELWALREVDLTVGEGEVVGVLGHNGAGKTTLLRLLAGITNPTEGRLRVAGRIAPLISLGVGFHQEMSGRENVLVNGMLLGLTAREVSQRFDSIVEFAELREVIDTPVKFYSSGMAMRLGFAVVIHVDPTILLVDEILAVGDAAFQLKCLERLRELQLQGAAIVMVSHAMHLIRQLCPRAVLIRQGRVVYDGEVERAIALHYRAISAAPAGGSAPGAVEVLERELVGTAGEHHHANYDEALELHLRLRLQRRLPASRIEFAVRTDSGLLVTAQSAPLPAEPPLEAGEELLVRIAFRARLGGGTYLLSARLTDSAQRDLGGCEDLILFVAGRPGSMGAVDLRASMRVDGVERADRRVTLLG